MAITSGISSALSGLLAAENRFRTSADNVANIGSVAAPSTDGPARDDNGDPLFRPARAVDQTTADGGVRSGQRLVDPSSVQLYDPTAPDADAEGLVNRPNVSLDREVTDQIAAQRQFEANLATVRTADALYESLLDIKS